MDISRHTILGYSYNYSSGVSYFNPYLETTYPRGELEFLMSVLIATSKV